MKRLTCSMLLLVALACMLPLFAAEPSAPATNSPLTCYPNPFNPSLTISYSPASEDASNAVSICVYNLRGELVRELWNNPIGSESFRITWTGLDDQHDLCANGVYLIAVRSVRGVWLQRAMMLK